MLIGFGGAATKPQQHHARLSGEVCFHDGVSGFSRGAPIENVGQPAKVYGESA